MAGNSTEEEDVFFCKIKPRGIKNRHLALINLQVEGKTGRKGLQSVETYIHRRRPFLSHRHSGQRTLQAVDPVVLFPSGSESGMLAFKDAMKEEQSDHRFSRMAASNKSESVSQGIGLYLYSRLAFALFIRSIEFK